MDRHPTPDEVLDQLGDKVVHSLAAIIAGAADDLQVYREALPQFVATSTARGLSNWIHDRMRIRALTEFDDTSLVSFIDSNPVFDMFVYAGEGPLFKIRLKRHSPTGRISTYPTQSALDFITQPNEDLLAELGTSEVHLCAGYEWDAETRSIGRAVLSLHDGSFDDPVWFVALPEAPSSATGTVTPTVPIAPTAPGPIVPTIEIVGDQAPEAEGSAKE